MKLAFTEFLKTEVLLRGRRLFLNNLKLTLNTILYIFFNVNKHLAVQFVELARSGSNLSRLRFFCLHRITSLGIPTVIQA